MKHIQQHYSDMEIEKAPYEFPYLSPYWLLRETVNPNAKDKSGSHLLSGAVMRSILTGAPYPQALMNAVMLRIHAEQDDSERHIKKSHAAEPPSSRAISSADTAGRRI